ncbi:hypothetical protein DEO72_LG7g2217 [Vigna unguiculata]|uniref:Uncharacterized protein n=1 Tax=Vigna unguiculata TaxID=3917 RepID=A0A4D6MHL2_VIGUN|nr:hypothetical protein DEO72_LG7g2217 [Vigna unguiculata]
MNCNKCFEWNGLPPEELFIGRRYSDSWKEILRLLEGDTQAPGRRYLGSWKEILRLLKGDTQAPGRRYSSSWKEILRLLDLETEAKKVDVCI